MAGSTQLRHTKFASSRDLVQLVSMRRPENFEEQGTEWRRARRIVDVLPASKGLQYIIANAEASAVNGCFHDNKR